MGDYIVLWIIGFLIISVAGAGIYWLNNRSIPDEPYLRGDTLLRQSSFKDPKGKIEKDTRKTVLLTERAKAQTELILAETARWTTVSDFENLNEVLHVRRLVQNARAWFEYENTQYQREFAGLSHQIGLDNARNLHYHNRLLQMIEGNTVQNLYYHNRNLQAIEGGTAQYRYELGRDYDYYTHDNNKQLAVYSHDFDVQDLVQRTLNLTHQYKNMKAALKAASKDGLLLDVHQQVHLPKFTEKMKVEMQQAFHDMELLKAQALANLEVIMERAKQDERVNGALRLKALPYEVVNNLYDKLNTLKQQQISPEINEQIDFIKEVINDRRRNLLPGSGH